MRKLIWCAHALALLACSAEPTNGDFSTAEVTHSPALPNAVPWLFGTVTQRQLGVAPDRPVAGVEACTMNLEGVLCVPSAVDGTYSLGPLQPHSRVEVRYMEPGFVPLIAEQDLLEHSLTADVFLLPESVAASIALARGSEHDPSRSAGLVVTTQFITYDGLVPLAGVSARASNGLALVFADDQNELDPALTSTSTSAWGAAFGVEPGPIQLELSHPDARVRCGRLRTNSVLESSVTVDATAGSVTLLRIYCLS